MDAQKKLHKKKTLISLSIQMLENSNSSAVTQKSIRRVFHTALGWIGMEMSSNGITRLTLPQINEELAAAIIGATPKQHSPHKCISDNLVRDLQDYSLGKQVSFNGLAYILTGSPFEQNVWTICKSIPYGQTRNYKWLASELGNPNSARAVGNALGKNPTPIIIPCHRIIASSGTIGGFAGEISMKRKLLALEGIDI